MTRPNAAYALPPGDRDEPTGLVDHAFPNAAPPPLLPGEAAPVAGRKPCSPDIAGEIATLAAAHQAAATALAELAAANAAGNWPRFEAAAWRYAESQILDLRARAARLRQTVTKARREAALADQQQRQEAQAA